MQGRINNNNVFKIFLMIWKYNIKKHFISDCTENELEKQFRNNI